MFWNGERWAPTHGRPLVASSPTRRSRVRSWLSTGVVAIALFAFAVPGTDVLAARLAARTLIAEWSSTSTVDVVNEGNSRIDYAGRWTSTSHSAYLGGKAKSTRASGASAKFRFTGAAIAWVGPVGPTRGKAKVYIDGVYVTTVSSRADTFQPARVLFKKSWSTVGTHRIAIVALGTAGHPTVALDAFVVRRDLGGSSTSGGTYAAVFTGDATGATDVTSALRSFLQSHNGQRVALASNGVYKVTQLSFTASNLTVDFRGARLQGSQAGAHGILRIVSSSNVVLNDPRVHGTGYAFADTTQWEHGIHVDGGAGITLNNPITRDTRGDGIFTGYSPGRNLPPTGVVINNPDIARAGRSGIAPVGGQVTIRGGRIAHVGLHGIDIEPNDAVEAASARVIIDGTDIRGASEIDAAGYGYAISAGWGHLATMKPSLVIQNTTGDQLGIVVMNTTTVKILNNTSDVSAISEIIDSTNVTFSGNVRITRL